MQNASKLNDENVIIVDYGTVMQEYQHCFKQLVSRVSSKRWVLIEDLAQM